MLKAEQDWQEPSSCCLVNEMLHFTAQWLPSPRHWELSGRGQTNIRPRRCSPLPTRSVIFLEFLKINLIPSTMVFPGPRELILLNTKHSLFQKEDPEASLLSLNPQHSPSGRSSASAPVTNRVSYLLNPGHCGFFRRR